MLHINYANLTPAPYLVLSRLHTQYLLCRRRLPAAIRYNDANMPVSLITESKANRCYVNYKNKLGN